LGVELQLGHRRPVAVACGRQEHDRIGLQAAGDERRDLARRRVKPVGVLGEDEQ
jgi:hypothetical protein